MSVVFFLYPLWQEARDDEHHDAEDEHGNGLGRAALPFLQDDAPYVGEHHVERHEDAEGERHEGRRLVEEALTQ